MKKKHVFRNIYSIILVFATIWSLLDTFVIENKVAAVDDSLANTSIYADLLTEEASVSTTNELTETSSTSTNTVLTTNTTNTSEPVITATSYQDENIQITITTIREYNTDIYVADVVVSDIAYLKTALAQNTFGRNIKATTSTMAEEHAAILAINGDYYGFRNAGFVLRNGVLYQTSARNGSNQDLVIYEDGSFEIIEEASSDAQDLYEQGAIQIFSFGPGLIEDGEILVNSNSEVSQSKNSNPRTAIGMIEPNHYIFLVSDGRTSQSAGLSLLELAQVMQEYGCTVAYNLDGGGSSTMVFNGVVVNNPTDGRSNSERKVSDIIYIGEQL